MSEHQRETAFLRHCLLYDDTGEGHKLEESIAQLQRNERCVRRAAWVMALLVALALAGLCYSAIFLANYSENISQFVTPFISKVFCALGLGSLISLAAFVGFWVGYRKQLVQRQKECRRLVTKLMATRLGNPLHGP